MKDGAWINSKVGTYCWITEHASWIQDPENARRLGVSPPTHAQIQAIPWDFNGPGRVAILLRAMEDGLIRVRGHQAITTFESTLPIETAIRAALPFMTDQFGPHMGCRFNNLASGEVFGAFFEEIQVALAQDNLLELIGRCT